MCGHHINHHCSYLFNSFLEVANLFPKIIVLLFSGCHLLLDVCSSTVNVGRFVLDTSGHFCFSKAEMKKV